MTPAPKRRWFRFSLRTLFVVVAVLAVPLGWMVWNANVVRARSALRDRFNIFFVETADLGPLDVSLFKKSPPSPRSLKFANPTASPHLSMTRRLLGDRLAGDIYVFEDADFDIVVRNFPEATVELQPPPVGWTLSRDRPPVENDATPPAFPRPKNSSTH